MKRIIIFGSSRNEGNTFTIANYLAKNLGEEVINLHKLKIAPYSYTNDHDVDDEFISLMEKLVQYDEWILLTPIYWYTMSAQMKLFLDRQSDILKFRKDLGKAVEGIGMRVFCCGSDPDSIPHFFQPFQLSADYLQMDYRGDQHLWLGKVTDMKPEVKVLLDDFLAGLG